MLDQPEINPERDALRRSAFARGIYELIASGLPGEPLRIGVYGEWGEGKSTVLKFVEAFCNKGKIPVIWFNPWAARDAAEMWRSLASEVRTKLRAHRSWKEWIAEYWVRIFASSDWTLRLVAKWKPWVAEVLSLEKAIDAAGRSLSRRRPALDRVSIERYLKKLPGGRRLVVIIDDVDRASPEVVPHLLLALREVFDVQSIAFVLALDPRVLAKALPTVHPGWGTTGEFIEKVIQFPFWLPPPDSDDILRLANNALEDLPLSVDRDVVRDLIDLVPKNPRRLKQYFRNILRLRSAIERHGRDEMNWPILLLFELMRGITPTVTAELVRSDSFLATISQATLRARDRKDPEAERIRTRIEEEVDTAYGRLGLSDASPKTRDELRRVILAFAQRAGYADSDHLRYWAQLAESPPIFTWREFRALLEEWRKDDTAERLHTLVESHARNREVAFDAALRDLFETAIRHRQQLLDRASGVDAAAHLDQLAHEAEQALRLIEQAAFDLAGFTGERPIFGLHEFDSLYQHIARWAHFTNRDVYRVARAAERGLLLRVAGHSEALAAPLLERLQMWTPFRDRGRGRDLLDRDLVALLTEFLFLDLRRRFSRGNGIGSLWGREKALPHKYVLFRRDSGFYTPEALEFLRDIARRAPENQAVQENLLQFLRLLAYGIAEYPGPVSRDDVIRMAQDREIVGLAWEAATSSELQPRTVGSLRETRDLLARIATSEEHLPLPHWWPPRPETDQEAADGQDNGPREA